MKKFMILALVAATSLSTAAMAQTPAGDAPAVPAKQIPTTNYEPQVQTQGNATFLTGGVGDDERAAIEASKSSYNLYVLSASKNGAFVGDSHVVITKGTETVLDTTAGPLLYVQLPAGKYTLDATHDGEQKHQNFTIGKAASTIHLSWKDLAVVTHD